MENEIAVKENAPMSVQEIRKQVNLIQAIMAEVMQKDQHYGVIPGCQKPSLLKAGAEKLSLTFRLRPIMDNDKDISIIEMANGHREVKVYCHILSASGQELATGIGSCSTMESKFRYRGGEKKGTGRSIPIEYWNLKKEGKIKEAQAILGGAKFAPGKIDGEWQICETGEKMENPDIADTYNTVLKMAKKRAYVDGILSATCASDIFTQDVEDFVSEETEKKSAVNIKPSVTMPQTKSSPVKKEEIQPPEPSETEEIPIEKPVNHSKALANANLISEAQGKRLYAIAANNKHSSADIKTFLKTNFGIEHIQDISKEYYEDIVAHFSNF